MLTLDTAAGDAAPLGLRCLPTRLIMRDVKLFSWRDFLIGFGVGLLGSLVASIVDDAMKGAPGSGLGIGMATGIRVWKTPSFWAGAIIGFVVGYGLPDEI